MEFRNLNNAYFGFGVVSLSILTFLLMPRVSYSTIQGSPGISTALYADFVAIGTLLVFGVAFLFVEYRNK
tara:strand:- start:855 stop:1064 length:210 start_codon:yes stop_codon:yes gene_type:complete